MDKSKFSSNKVIVLTGGHAITAALATIEKIDDSKLFKEASLHWIGSIRPIEGKQTISIEQQVFPKFGVQMHTINAGRIQRRFSKYTIPSLLKIPLGMVQAFLLLLKIRPNVVLSFGGYAGFPVVFAAFLLGIPVILHEQTVAVGLANKVSAFFAHKIAISYSESAQFFPKNKIILTGNPLVKAIAGLKPKKQLSKRPVIFITGGSRGSQILNKTLEGCLDRLTEKYYVIHQTGQLDYDYFALTKKKIKNKSNYEVHAFFSPLEIADYYKQADVYVGRSGANTVSEIVLLRLPAIFVPIPWTRYDEQTKNAYKAKDLGIATVLDQNKLTSDMLLSAINKTILNWTKIVSTAEFGEYERNKIAADNLVALIVEYLL